MKRQVFLSLVLFAVSTLSLAETLPQPPFFNPDADAMEVLEKYPLGVITEFAAGIHHGKADKVLSLPNGLTGWKYVVGGVTKPKTYVQPSGEKIAVNEVTRAHITKTYILVFGKGKVIDVLYHGEDQNDHITALLVQVLDDKTMAPQ